MQEMQHVFLEQHIPWSRAIRKRLFIEQIECSSQVKFCKDVNVEVLPVQSFLPAPYHVFTDDLVDKIEMKIPDQ